MLTLRHRNEWRGKCPRHPMQQYDYQGALPASCDVCERLYRVELADRELTRLEENAIAAVELAKARRNKRM